MNIIKLSRTSKKILLVINDLILAIIALYVAYYLRVNELLDIEVYKIFLVSLIYIFSSWIFGCYNHINRYISYHTLLQWLKASAVNLLLITIIIYYDLLNAPRSIGVIQSLTLFLFVILSRKLYIKIITLLSETEGSANFEEIIIYGADNFGISLYSRLDANKHKVIAYVDDDLDRQNLYVSNVKIYSKKGILKHLKNKTLHVSKILVKNSDFNSLKNKNFFELLKEFNISIKRINDDIYFEGADNLNVLTQILDRDWVDPDYILLNKAVTGKVILITGAGGSIGSEICRQILQFEPKKLIIVDNSEYSLFKINMELLDINNGIEIIPILESICSKNIKKIFIKHKIQSIYHAAAYKHVGLVELNIESALYNNIIGLNNILKLAIDYEVLNFVLISTDKAVKPTNIMGLTKRISELLVYNKSLSNNLRTKLDIVRFGNVIGSSGSAVQIFREQIANGGPVTVTHPDATRYFMSIPEAAQLVIQSTCINNEGGIFILDMGRPIKIIDLARAMINANSLDNIEISIIGLKAGEKLHEELSSNNPLVETKHNKIRIAKNELINVSNLDQIIIDLFNLIDSDSYELTDLHKLLKKIEPAYDF